MSAATRAADAFGRRDAIVRAGVLAAGVLALAVRPHALVQGRTALFTVAYGIIAAASIALPAERDRARLAPAAVLAMGLAAVMAAAAATGPPVPWPAGTWALPLSILAAVAEEALFRRAGYAWLSRFGPIVAIVTTAALFAFVHVPAYGVVALPVDLGAGLLFGWQRWASGSWTVPAATHAAANVLAVLG